MSGSIPPVVLVVAVAAVNEAEVFRIIEKPFDRFTIRSAVFLALDALGRLPS